MRSFKVRSLDQEQTCSSCGRVITLGGGGYRLQSDHLPSVQVACRWQCVQDALHIDLAGGDDRWLTT